MRVRGALLLAWIAVGGSAAAAADTVKLANGDVVTGTVVEQTDAGVTLDHAVLGRMTLAAAQVAEVARGASAPAAVAAEATGSGTAATEATPNPQPPGAASAVATAASPADLPRGWFGTSLFRGWKTSLAAGFSGSAGNTEGNSVNAQFKMAYEDDRDRIVWDNTYFLKTQSGERSQNEFKTDLVRDWFIPDSKWFWFASAGYQFDDFKAWEHRASVFGGPGYTWVKNDDLEFLTRFGAGVTYEAGQVDELTPEALIGAAIVKWNITETQTLSASNTFYPSFRALGEFRNVTSLEWKVKLDGASGLSLKLGLENEYESAPDDGDEANDIKYFGALVVDF